MHVAAGAAMGEDRSRLAGGEELGRKGRSGGNGDAEEEVPEVRGLLLQAEHAVRARARGAVPHLPTRRARPEAGASAGVRVSHRTHARGIRVSTGERALLTAPGLACNTPAI